MATVFHVAALACAQPPTPAEKEQIRTRLGQLSREIDDLRGRGIDDNRLADIEIYRKAVTWILRFEDEFYTPEYVANTLQALDHGLARAADTQFSWESKTGRIVRAYRSRIDDSIQPYAVTIPQSYDGSKPARMDVILHGRNDQLNEISFLAAQQSDLRPPPAQDFIQLEVFGRGNNGYRWAGETDVFEAIDSVRARYRIDDRKIVLRGSSTDGAGARHLGLHYPDKWAAVEAGAGFAETKQYAKLGDMVRYEQAMLNIYDAAPYASNAQMVQSRDAPDHVHFVTYTAAYHRCYWISIEGLERQYERAEVDAQRTGAEVRVTTHNVSRLKIDGASHAVIDGQSLDLVPFGVLTKDSGPWRIGGGISRYKKPGLQGPIDDAFRDAFLCVRPTGKPQDKTAGEFVRQTLEQFRQEFAKWMRGDIRIKDDKDVTADDIARYHLVLFGDPSSNRWIKRIAPALLRVWPDGSIVPVLISPNPLNHERYVVLNSGHTFHEPEFKGSSDLLYPRLGDFAMIEVTGRRVLRGGIFESNWRQLMRFPPSR